MLSRTGSITMMVSVIPLVFIVAAELPNEAVKWKDVRPIIQRHCAVCHQPGGAAPFSLLEASSVQVRAAFVEAVIENGLMPPWTLDAGVAGWHGARHLPSPERDLISAWVRDGAPLGEDQQPATAPPVPFIRPDLTVRMDEAWTIPAEGGENWGRRERDAWSFVLPLKNENPLRVQAIGHESSAPTTVHAVTYLSDQGGSLQWMDGRTEGPGHYMSGDVRDDPTGSLGATGVGARVLRLPDGFHFEIPADSDLGFTVHYRPEGRSRPLQEEIQLECADDEDSRPLRTIISMVRSVDLPAGETAVMEDQLVVPETVDLVGITPRAIGVCTALQVWADVPGDQPQLILSSSDWDPHWRKTFVLDTPMELPEGTVIRSSWKVENTEENLRNPFLPLGRLSMARRTGAMSMLLHVAAEDEASDARMLAWHRELMRSRIR